MQLNANTASIIILFFASLAVNGAPVNGNGQEFVARATTPAPPAPPAGANSAAAPPRPLTGTPTPPAGPAGAKLTGAKGPVAAVAAEARAAPPPPPPQNASTTSRPRSGPTSSATKRQ
ncbi:hypothetical protein G7Y89_g9805 [Cudoniella acicularis]|uniref:Uncharacterized protein n=1 Tax=Cudoniella acicularis TaxID=354080 RepID=A0A8H4RG91_9HELO|nr:hypothetical protein G7Y89_g9805 [Cudoniella acicularis]